MSTADDLRAKVFRDRQHTGDWRVEKLDRELWSALRLIRESVEELAPPGAVPNDEYLGPEPMREAEAIIRGIHAISKHSRT